MKRVFTIILVAVAIAGCKNRPVKMTIEHLPYPVAYMDTTVVDNYFGTLIADPYRWMEDDNAAETKAWVVAENEVTFDYLSKIPFRNAIRERLTTLWNYPKIGMPSRVGDRYFFFANDGLQNQSVLYMRETLDSEPVVFLDPNTLSADGTVALGAISFSDDGKYMAYSTAAAGSDWVNIFVKEIPSGKVLSDRIEWVKFSGGSWAHDSKGFYYSRYDAPKKGSELTAQNQYQKVYYHLIGTPQIMDRLVYSDLAHPLRYFNGGDDGDTGKWLFVYGSEGTHGTELLYKKATDATFKVLFAGFEYDYGVVNVEGDIAYIYTNENAPNYRLVAVNLENPSDVRDILPEGESLLEGASFVGGQLFATYMVDAVNKVKQYNMDGTFVRDVEVETVGSIGGFGGKKEYTETFYSLSNYLTPPTTYRYNIADGTSTIYNQTELSYDPSQFVAEQVFFTSKDGTSVPMFLVHRKDLKKNGTNPVYMYGYGGFNIPLTPGFNPTNIAMVEQGAIYAVVNLRGGSEYGETWHKAGMLENKQNVFDDFIAAAEYLIEEDYTSPEYIAIAGGSNGGLLVGACMTQRPDLFAVAFPAVGVMDMLRYHKFTVGWGWAVEYGSSDNEEQFKYILEYSPLHNIKPGIEYPATMVTTADHDDRVVPAHSFKFAATLQAAQTGDAPTLIRIETNAGHGAGKPTSKRIDEATDVLSFFFANTTGQYK